MSHPNMSTLMKRLEAATSRLEDLANFYEADKVPQPVTSASVASSAALSPGSTPKGSVDLLAKAAQGAAQGGAGIAGRDHQASVVQSPGSRSVSAAPQSATTTPAPPSAPGIKQHEYKILDALGAKLESLLKMAQTIDEQLFQQCLEFKKGHDYANNIAKLAGGVIKPAVGPEFTELYKPVNQQVEKIASFRDTNRRSKFINHFQVVAEGALVFGWVSCPNPSDYVKDLKEAAQFYANKVLKEYREVPPHAEWIKAFLSYCNDLAKALDDELPDGLDWNPKGITLGEALKQGLVETAAPSLTVSPKGSVGGPSTPSAPKASGAPAPPPGPPPSSSELMASSAAPSGGAMDALFADIAKGTDIHSNLKHIDRKALKNKPKPPKPGSKGATPAPSAGAPSASASKSAPPAGPPSTTLNDNKWLVENYTDNHELVLELEMKHTVYIENCHRCTIVIKNKGTSVVLNNCSKVGIMVDTLISGLDFLGCTDCQAQTNGRLPSLMLDKSNNMQIYLNEESLDVDIRTVNTWSINLEIPTGEPGDYEEVPIAEQISHTIDREKRKVKSVAVAPGM